jgi:hypothetical protein
MDGRVVCWHSGPCPNGAEHVPYIKFSDDERQRRSERALARGRRLQPEREERRDRMIGRLSVDAAAVYDPDTFTLGEYQAARAAT